MEYLIRFAQAHESFRQAEIQALADLAGVKLEIIHYDKNVSSINSFLLFLSPDNLYHAFIVRFLAPREEQKMSLTPHWDHYPVPAPMTIHHLSTFYTYR